MPSTKIINVLRDDSFEEVLDIFKETPAKEVIFILPKNCKAFKKEADFAALNKEASNQDKSISLLCSNSKTNQLAKKYDFDVLLAKTREEKSNISTVNQYEEQKTNISNTARSKIIKNPEDVPPWGDYELPGEPIIEPAIADISTENSSERILDHRLVGAVKVRKMEDIISPDNEQSHIKISPKKEKSVKITIKREAPEARINIKNSGIWSDWSKQKTDTGRDIKKFGVKFTSKTIICSMAVAAAVLLGIILYISSGNAKITIRLRKEPVDMRFKVSASDKYSSVDTGYNKIPGQVFNIEKTVSQTFKSTGQKDAIQKSRGKLTIYNELNIAQPLIATTRFESETGLIFRTLKNIVVPAAGSSGSGLLVRAGSVIVEIIADKPGQEYNIDPGKFVIIAFREKGDTEKYQKIYAKSSESMHGGINGKAIIVSDIDYDSAKELITQQLSTELNDTLKAQASQFKVINASDVVFSDPESLVKPDDAASEFSMTISAVLKAVGVREEDLYKLINEYAKKNSNLRIVPEKVAISYDKIKLNEAGNTLEFDLLIKGNGYANINEDQIINDLLGVGSKEIRSYFQANQNIELAKITLKPFWIKKMPKDRERIKYEIEY